MAMIQKRQEVELAGLKWLAQALREAGHAQNLAAREKELAAASADKFNGPTKSSIRLTSLPLSYPRSKQPFGQNRLKVISKFKSVDLFTEWGVAQRSEESPSASVQSRAELRRGFAAAQLIDNAFESCRM